MRTVEEDVGYDSKKLLRLLLVKWRIVREAEREFFYTTNTG